MSCLTGTPRSWKGSKKRGEKLSMYSKAPPIRQVVQKSQELSEPEVVAKAQLAVLVAAARPQTDLCSAEVFF